MNVLSLFDGISCAQMALKNAGISVDKYYASEIDDKAMSVTLKNFPDTIMIGDVTKLASIPGKIDILIGGSPCQDLSIAKKGREGLNGTRSGLFWHYVTWLRKLRPKYFILENVASMSDESMCAISSALGTTPWKINSKNYGSQNRERYYWTNIPFIPDDGFVSLLTVGDVLQENPSGANYYRLDVENYVPSKNIRTISKTGMIRVGHFNKGGQGQRVYSTAGKSATISALGGGWGAKTGLYQVSANICRSLAPIECERLQNLPTYYTYLPSLSVNDRIKMLGNAFDVAVVSRILGYMK